MSERGLVELAKQGLIVSEKLIKLEFCDNCILGKQHRVKFESGMHNLVYHLSMFTQIYGVRQGWQLMGMDSISSLLLIIFLKDYGTTF